jgi:hypothetical protein
MAKNFQRIERKKTNPVYIIMFILINFETNRNHSLGERERVVEH